MSASHTPEPWHRNVSAKYPIYALRANPRNDRDWRHVAAVLGNDDVAEADLRRIVAAVNACAGISTEALERVDFHGRARLIQLQRIIEDALDKPENAP